MGKKRGLGGSRWRLNFCLASFYGVFIMLKKIGTSVALFSMSIPAFAVTDVSAITAAQTDLLAYAAALLALGVAVWAALKVVRMFGGK